VTFAEQVEAAIFRRFRTAIRTGEDPVQRMVREQVEQAFKRTERSAAARSRRRRPR